jgi:aquaporin Z
MIKAFQKNWKIYLIEAWALGMFMVSACAFVILFEHPNFGLPLIIPSPFLRRALIGLAMGITAVLLIYSKWGKQSGAHLNPAVTLANYQLDRIVLEDATWYIIAQCAGATFFVFVFKLFAFLLISNPSVNYVITIPGTSGVWVAFIAELVLSFTLFIVVLFVSNSSWAKFTGYFAGSLVFLFIAFEGPLSGMSINPARSFGSALPAQNWDSFWLYIIAPITGMQSAALLYRKGYMFLKNECKSLNVFMSGDGKHNAVYKVLCWYKKDEDGKIIKYS